MITSLIKILRDWQIDFNAILAKLVLASIVFLIFYALGKIFKRIAYKINSKVLSRRPDLQGVLAALIYYFFLFTGVFLFLQIIGLEAYFVKILAGAGIVGIIAGFALKDIASNAFSGILLFIEKPFKKDDWVQVDGHYGKILNIKLLTTELVNRTGQQVFISNQLIYSGAFINYSKFDKRGIRLQATVLQYFDLTNLQKIALDALRQNKSELTSDGINFYVTSIANDGNFTFEIHFWVNFNNEEEFKRTVSDTLIALKQVGVDNKINIVNVQWISDETDTTSAEAFGNGG